MSPDTIKKALEILKNDGVCIFPTDTVYGLFCRAKSKKASAMIYRIKGRSNKKPLQLFLPDKKEVFVYAIVSPYAKRRISRLLPGSNTVILKLKNRYKNSFSFLKTGTAGFRVIDSMLINSILGQLKEPLAATSANSSGGAAPRRYKDIEENIVNMVKMAVKDDKKVIGKPSKVLDLTGKKEKVIRL
jgi:L-threonylcarbamoyladenylate synthase